MQMFELHTVGHVFETYTVAAESRDEVRRMFEAGLLLDPIRSEVADVCVDWIDELA